MYLVYVGESGNTGTSNNDPNQPHHVHVGLLVHESQSVSINGEFNALFRRHFGRPPGEPESPKALRPAEIYQGVGDFSSWLPAKRNELIQDCLNILMRRRIPVIISYLDKQEVARAGTGSPDYSWQSPSEPSINRFLLALSMYMDELNLSGLAHGQLTSADLPVKDLALVVAGEGRSVQPEFMTRFLKSEDGFDASALVENIYFVDLANSVGTQLANLCAYFTRRWLQKPSDSHPYFDALRDGEVIQVIYPVRL